MPVTKMRMEPIVDASAWHGADLERDRSWEYVLDAAHLADLDRALSSAKLRRLQLARVTRDAFALPRLEHTLARTAMP